MYPSSRMLALLPVGLASLLLAIFPAPSRADSNSYFVVDNPSLGTQWVNGQANLLQWEKGLLDGVDTVDIELARSSTDGLIFVARNAPSSINEINVLIQDVPNADDYFVFFLNSTHGVTYAVSQRFTILASGSSSTNGTITPASSAPTVTVSGGPNPTVGFATTFPAVSGAQAWRFGDESKYQLFSIVGVTIACLLGATRTLL